jgi:ATP-dependent DNA helicase DinG
LQIRRTASKYPLLIQKKNMDDYLNRIPIQAQRDIEATLDAMQKAIPDFHARAEQKRMILALAASFFSQGLVVCEGPTGVGKSLSYLVAGGVAAKHMQKKLVLATATVSLQEQLLRDLPNFVSYAKLDLQFGLSKGRSRYACVSRLIRASSREGRDVVFMEHSDVGHEASATLREMAETLHNGWDGDRDSWAGQVSDHLWHAITTDRHGCSKRRCEHLSSCPYYVDRNRLRDCDIIVTNQDVLLSDLELGGGYLLPKPEECLYVIDEGHHLERKAVEHFTKRVRLMAVEQSMERLPKITTALARLLKDNEVEDLSRRAIQHAGGVGRAVANLVTRLSNYGPIQMANGPGGDVDTPRYRFPKGEMPPEFASLAGEVYNTTTSLAATLQALRQCAAEATGKGDVISMKAEPWLSALGRIYGRIEKSMHAWAHILNGSKNCPIPVAKWIEVEEHQGKLDYLIHAADITAAPMLQEMLWGRAHAAAVTSATITVGGEFKHYAAATGLKAFPKAEYLKLESPFDYANQAVLRVPAMRTLPGRDDGHTIEVAELLPGLIADKEAALVLFSSRSQLQDVLKRLPPQLLSKCLVQNTRSRRELLAEHARRVSNGQGSVLCGLQSFAEGLDLPGNLCTHVVICKLPFSPPDNPVDEAKAEWIASRGGNPFIQMAVPQACVRLAQAVGRLIRREGDHGKVTLLDRRIVERNYGELLLRSLPPMRKEIVESREKQVA